MNYNALLPKKQEICVNGVSLLLHVVENSEWLLTDVQVARAYGISTVSIRRHVQRNKDALIEGTHWFKKHGNLPRYFPHLRLWTREGLIKLGNFIKTSEAETLLVALNVKSRQRTKPESAFVDIIRSTFNEIIPVEFQYSAGKYKIDIYFPTLKLAVEIDEFNHVGYSSEKEIEREKFISETLECDLIRFNPNIAGNNVGKLINLILMQVIRGSRGGGKKHDTFFTAGTS